jgi:hypothetical protein
MLRLALALAVLPAAACTMSADTRPKTLEYVTETVLSPYCGSAQCHSSFTHSYNYTFDTVKGAQRSILDNHLAEAVTDSSDPAQARIVVVVANATGLTPEIGRMPYDAPLPEDDIKLLEAWVAAGAEGAQCDPDAPEGVACNGDSVVECGPNGNFFTAPLIVCSMGCEPGNAMIAAAHCK